MLTAIKAAQRLRGMSHRVLLHSGRNDYDSGRQSIVAAAPKSVFRATFPAPAQVVAGGIVRPHAGDVFSALRRWVDGFAPDSLAIGYIGYEAGQYVERLPQSAHDEAALPDMYFGEYPWALVFADGGFTARGAVPQDVLARLGEARSESEWQFGPLHTDQTYEDYEQAIARIKRYIYEGDIYQANLARRFTSCVESAGDIVDLYQRAQAVSPATFGAALDFPEVAIASISPELFLSRVGDRVVTAPIKGTRKRDASSSMDAVRQHELANDEKESAEHLMIVDLLRNDLGRVATIGSVAVEKYAEVIALPTLFHLVSTIAAEVPAATGCDALLRALFPGGSITGAPKIRAQEIICELEPVRRGPYTGAIGWLEPRGDLLFSIAIRTAVIAGNQLRMHFGGGIVADSTAAREYEETEEKAYAWRRSLGLE